MESVIIFSLIFCLFYVQSTSLFRAYPLVTSVSSPFTSAINDIVTDKEGLLYVIHLGKEVYLIEHNRNPYLIYTEKDNSVEFIAGQVYQDHRQPQQTLLYLADRSKNRVLQLLIEGNKVISNKVICINSQTNLNLWTLSITSREKIYLLYGREQINTRYGDGEVWMCQNGKIQKFIKRLDQANSFTLSQNEQSMFISENYNLDSQVVQQRVWKFDQFRGEFGNAQLLYEFRRDSPTGNANVSSMVGDIMDNLFLTRSGQPKVVKLSKEGDLIYELDALTPNPIALELGSSSGQILYIAGSCHDDTDKGCIYTWDNRVPGRSWSLLKTVSS